MTDTVLHPALLLIGGGLLLPWLRGAVRSAAVVAIPLIALAFVWQVPDGAVWQARFLEHTITPLQGDKLSRLFATIFALMAAGGGWFALGQRSRVELPAAFVYAGSAIGVALAGDLISVFVFWELMAIGSTLVIWSQGEGAAYRAARRYLMIHLLGGVLLFAGITGHVVQTGSVAFTRLAPDSVAQGLILIGFLVNAGAPPLSAWLPDAYPEASWSGTVFLSAFTTKVAVYALMRGFPGTELLVWVGLFMVFYGIVYALLENDMRRMLAYAIVNQGGFMIAGVGIGTEMALNGAAAQAFTGIVYVALLLMAAGSVLLMTGRRKFSELGGLYRTMPVTAACGTIGALAISSFPLTSGFVSKSMVSQAASDGQMLAAWMLLTAASAGAVLHAGLKFPWFVFFHKDSGLRPTDPPASMRWAMVLFALLCIVPGIWPEALYAMLPHRVEYVPYTVAHVLTQLQLLLFAALAFFVMVPPLKRTLTLTLDTDWVWRRLLPSTADALRRLLAAAMRSFGRAAEQWVQSLIGALERLAREDGTLARRMSTRSMALYVMAMLLAYLVIYLVP
ncbi:MAG: Na(+)/H(+) antiporter subunit D [Burkholderiaceae bacterium]|nr:Na(+)/H(+) antiporter subunit D [Burkholderiaceae bacterium]